VIFTLLVFASFSQLQRNSADLNYRQLTLGPNSRIYTAVVAYTPAAREQGLSGQVSLKPNTGMLFVFDKPEQACFWMKDMRFNLDILWYDANSRLIYEQQNLSPTTYPRSYCPPMPARYVVEVPAGTAAQLGLSYGDKLQDVTPVTKQ
jgi:uncharacterized membrane protein (UPF0127 family)